MKKLGGLFAFLLAVALVGVASLPSRSQQSVMVPATMFQIPIVGTASGASAELVALTAGQRIYVTGLFLTPVATAVVTFTTGTGTACATGSSNLTGAMTFAAGQEVNWGSGNGALLVTPAGQALCVTIATAVAPGALAYAKF